MSYKFLSTIQAISATFTGNSVYSNGTPNRTVKVDAIGLYLSRTSDGTYPSSITADGSMYYNTRNSHIFRNDGTVSMTLFDNTRNVGIGTTTDAGYKLDVNGTARVQGQLEVLSTSSAQGLLLKHTALSTTATQIYYNSSDAVTYLDTLFSYTASQPFGSVNIRTKDSLNALTSRLYVEGNSGNVGIGTTTFLGKFQVGSGSATQFQVASSGASIYVGPSSGNYNMNITTNTIQSSNSGTTNTYLYIQPNGTGNVAMCSSGTNKVLIGTTTDAGFKLDVNGTSMFRGATQYTADIALNNNRLYIGSLNGNTVLRPVSTTNLQLYNNNTGATLFLNANGAVQIGQHTGSSWAYFTASSSILYNTVTLPSLAGTGTRMVVADATGILSTQAVPTGTITGSGTTNYVSKWSSSSSLTNSLLYDDGTNVGIGTASPTAKLTVVGAGTGVALIGDPGFVGSNYTAISLNNTLSTSSYNFLSSPTDATLYINRPSGVSIRFREANGANQMVIETGGNVLIGTSTDNGAKLQVAGNATLGQGQNRPVTYDSNGGNFRITANPGGWATGYFFNGSSGTFRGGFGAYGDFDNTIYHWIGDDYNIPTMTLYPNQGNVGISTTSPAQKLDVNGLIRTNRTSNTDGGLVFGTAGTYLYGADSGGYLATYTTNLERIRVTSDGNVGIGTANPNGFATTGRTILSLNGASNTLVEFKVGDAFQNYIYSTTSTFELYSSSIIDFQSSGGSKLRIASSGNVLVGTTTDNGFKLNVAGSIYSSAFVKAYTSFVVERDASDTIGSGSYLALVKASNSYQSIWQLNSSAGVTLFSYDGAWKSVISTNGSTGATTIPNLGGSGTRMVVADASGTLSTQAIPGGGSANGSWQDNNTQTVPTNLTGYGVEFSTLNFRTGVNVIQDTGGKYTLIQMTNAGRYNIQFSFQYQNTSSSAHDVYVWFRKNGETPSDDIPDSNTLISIPAKHGTGTPGHTVAAWNFFVEAAAMDYYQIAWATDDNTSVTMEAYSSTGFCPSTPSAILTVNQVD